MGRRAAGKAPTKESTQNGSSQQANGGEQPITLADGTQARAGLTSLVSVHIQPVSQQASQAHTLSAAQVPVAIPPGMDPGMAKSLIEYLRSNPEAAKATYNEAQRLLQVRCDPYVHTCCGEALTEPQCGRAPAWLLS